MAVHSTEVVPAANSDPDAGSQTIVGAMPELSVASTLNVTVAVPVEVLIGSVIWPGVTVKTGAVPSLTESEYSAGAGEFPDASVIVQLTVSLPIGIGSDDVRSVLVEQAITGSGSTPNWSSPVKPPSRFTEAVLASAATVTLFSVMTLEKNGSSLSTTSRNRLTDAVLPKSSVAVHVIGDGPWGTGGLPTKIVLAGTERPVSLTDVQIASPSLLTHSIVTVADESSLAVTRPVATGSTQAPPGALAGVAGTGITWFSDRLSKVGAVVSACSRISSWSTKIWS